MSQAPLVSQHSSDDGWFDSANQPHPAVAEFLELTRYRYLLWNLTRRDITVRYKRTWIGIFWVMLNPLLTTIVLVTIFSTQFRVDIPHFGVYVLSGLLLWTLFSEASNGAMVSLLGHAYIINKVHVPPSVFVISAVLSATLIHVFDLGPLIVVAIVDGVPIRFGWLLLPFVLLQTAIFSAGIGLLLSAFVIYFNDVINFYQLVLRIGFFVTPIFFPLTSLGHIVSIIVYLNPLTYLVESFRSVIFDGRLSWTANILPCSAITLITFAIGWYVFTRFKREFAYRV